MKLEQNVSETSAYAGNYLEEITPQYVKYVTREVHTNSREYLSVGRWGYSS